MSIPSVFLVVLVCLFFHMKYSISISISMKKLVSTWLLFFCSFLSIFQSLFYFLKFYIYLLVVPGFSCGMQTLTCSMWDLIPWPGIKPMSPCIWSWSLSHWTTREVPIFQSLNKYFFCKNKPHYSKNDKGKPH